jgi:hypothetical protein
MKKNKSLLPPSGYILDEHGDYYKIVEDTGIEKLLPVSVSMLGKDDLVTLRKRQRAVILELAPEEPR